MKNQVWSLRYLFVLIVLLLTGLSCDDDNTIDCNFPPHIEGKWELQKEVNQFAGKEVDYKGKDLVYDFQTDGILNVYSAYFYDDPKMGKYDYGIIIEGEKSKLEIEDLVYDYEVKGEELIIDGSSWDGSILYLSRLK